jgi:hypothetical protein
MTSVKNILVVARTGQLAATLVRVVRNAGYQATVVSTFAAAKSLLDLRPALLLSEGKLGDYNGLHLALRAKLAGCPAIVVGDQAFQPDADQLGVTCVAPDAIDRLRMMIGRILDTASLEAMPWVEESYADGPSERANPRWIQ